MIHLSRRPLPGLPVAAACLAPGMRRDSARASPADPAWRRRPRWHQPLVGRKLRDAIASAHRALASDEIGQAVCSSLDTVARSASHGDDHAAPWDRQRPARDAPDACDARACDAAWRPHRSATPRSRWTRCASASAPTAARPAPDRGCASASGTISTVAVAVAVAVARVDGARARRAGSSAPRRLSICVPSTTNRRPPTNPRFGAYGRSTATNSCSNTEEAAKRLVCA